MQFFPVTDSHYSTICQWFELDHVKQWYYGKGLESTLKNLKLHCKGIYHNGEYGFRHWIGYLNNEPFAFLMTSPIDPKQAAHTRYLPAGATASFLDLLIGPPQYLGKGLAATMIQSFISQQYAHMDYFLIDPESSHTKAIHVYEKAGFQVIDDQYYPPHNETVCHTVLRMKVKQSKKPN